MKCETVTQTEYVVRIIVPKTTHEMFVRHCAQFTPTIRGMVLSAVKQAARQALQKHIASGELDKCFRVESDG